MSSSGNVRVTGRENRPASDSSAASCSAYQARRLPGAELVLKRADQDVDPFAGREVAETAEREAVRRRPAQERERPGVDPEVEDFHRHPDPGLAERLKVVTARDVLEGHAPVDLPDARLGVEQPARPVEPRCGKLGDVLVEHLDTGGGATKRGRRRVVGELARIAGDCGLRPPAELTMLGKTLLNLDQVAGKRVVSGEALQLAARAIVVGPRIANADNV